jgi:hypothetical protein
MWLEFTGFGMQRCADGQMAGFRKTKDNLSQPHQNEHQVICKTSEHVCGDNGFHLIARPLLSSAVNPRRATTELAPSRRSDSPFVSPTSGVSTMTASAFLPRRTATPSGFQPGLFE